RFSMNILIASAYSILPSIAGGLGFSFIVAYSLISVPLFLDKRHLPRITILINNILFFLFYWCKIYSITVILFGTQSVCSEKGSALKGDDSL
ncbi:MAG: hypothetical protein K2P28_01140, partial [Lachnospiraceae bacterium]|nr:hypothetical protein [Lachnospiraceae bacterium]